MSVYCPCEKECSRYSGTPRRCKRVETSKAIPDRFVRHVATLAADGSGSVLSAFIKSMAVYGGAHLLSESENTSYEVWQCPGCNCEVLYQISKQPGGERKEKLYAAATCSS